MDRLVVEDVHKRLGGNPILKGVSFALAPGDVVALLGASGSGKTTLLRAIAGLDHPDRGRIALGDEVLFDGANGVAVPPDRRNLGLVFQSYALWPHRTVFENVAYPLKLRGVSRDDQRRRAEDVLARLGLAGLSGRHPHQLSGGQQQRVALARAIVYEPRVLLLDEPLSNLDAKLREEARSWLRALIQALHISAVCVTHDQVEALAIADHVLLLDEGRIVQEGTPEEMYARPASLFTAEFMGSNNRLAGRLAEVKGGLARVEGDGFSLWGRARGALRAGEAATAVVRVERTRLAAAAGDDTIPAEVETALFLGERWEVVLRARGARLRAWVDEAPGPGPHHVRMPKEAVWVFPGKVEAGVPAVAAG
jgi:iron(III) transport system ATP-binding protein